jgi:hypothetical protein
MQFETLYICEFARVPTSTFLRQPNVQGYQIVQDKERADVWLLNSCTVKNPAEEGRLVRRPWVDDFVLFSFTRLQCKCKRFVISLF